MNNRSCYPLIDDPNSPLGEEEIIQFKSFEYSEEDNFENSGRLNIHMWAHNRDSDSCLMRVTNFRNYCCLEPENFTRKKIPSPDGDWKKDKFEPDNYISWDENIAAKVFEAICYKQSNSTSYKKPTPKETPFDYYFGRFRDIYYYTGTKKPYLYLFFDTIKGRNELLETLKNPIWAIYYARKQD